MFFSIFSFFYFVKTWIRNILVCQTTPNCGSLISKARLGSPTLDRTSQKAESIHPVSQSVSQSVSPLVTLVLHSVLQS